MQKAPPCLFIKEAINALEISLSTWIQSAAKLKPVIIYIRHWWKRTRPSEEPGGAGRRWGVSPPECSRRRPGSTKLVPAHQSAAKAPQRRRHMPSDKGVSGWFEGFWRKCSCWFHQHMKEVIRRKLQTPACGWATFMSQMNDSLEWPPPTPPHQSSSVTADALKASFIPSDGGYLCSWLILPSCTLFQCSKHHKCQPSPLKAFIPSSSMWFLKYRFVCCSGLKTYFLLLFRSKLAPSPDESPACRGRPPAFTLLLAAVSVSVVMVLLTSAVMTVWGHVESRRCWFQCEFWEDVWCKNLSFLEGQKQHACFTTKMRKVLD